MHRAIFSLGRRGLCALFCAGFLIAGGALAAAEPESPSATVVRLNAVLLEVMQNADDLGYAGRHARLKPVLNEVFDFRRMARSSIGSSWNKLTDGQREDFVEAFAGLSVATYAARFDGYSGERFEVISEEPGRRGRILVRNQLIKSDGEAIRIDYLTHEKDGAWRVVDVLLKSTFSELAAKRSEYVSVIMRDGFETLLAALRDKTSALGSL